MRKPTFLSLAVVFVATVSAPLALAQGTYTQIDEPDALFGTFCSGINTAGDIIGFYTIPGNYTNGFLLSGGTYTVINYPRVAGTILTGINDKGMIVGYTASGTFGFAYNRQAQTFIRISRYGLFSYTYPYAINNAGTIAGYLSEVTSGFELVASGRGKTIAVPGAIDTDPFGISASGEVVGIYNNGSGDLLNFSFSRGQYQQLLIPGAPLAKVFGINPAGTALVGSYTPSSGVTAGFLYQNNALTTLQFPGSSNTSAAGINASGMVVGTFYDASGTSHGFLWTPFPDMARK
jgi:probable HAF family extracellular repeat protein